jgi:hypothetical protein
MLFIYQNEQDKYNKYFHLSMQKQKESNFDIW